MSRVLAQGSALSPETFARLHALLGGTRQPGLHPAVAHVDGVKTPLSHATLEFARQERLDLTVYAHPLQPGDFRLLAMDMDSTLITIECIDELADLAGVKPQVAAITGAAMRGELDFAGALRQRVALLTGLEASALDRVYEERLQLSPGAESLLAFARKHGWQTLLVSGGFTFFPDRLKIRLGLHHTLANTLEIVAGKLTGRILGPIIDADAKAAEVGRICAQIGCPTQAAIVLGDGANDLKMMALAGWSVAFRAKPVVQSQANMAINFGGLDALLNLFE